MLGQLLIDSFRQLLEEPRFFVPKLFSTFLSSLWLLGFVEGSISIFHMLVSFPLIAVTGVFASLMVASMVEKRESEGVLGKSFREAFRNWREVVSAAGFFIAAGFLVSLPLSIGLVAYLRYGSRSVAAMGAALSLLLVIGVTFASYFLPITLLEKTGFVSGFKRSLESSQDNPGAVITLTLFSMALLGVAAVSGEYLKALGYLGFLLGRLISTVVNTYLFVVSPSYYIQKS